MATSTYTLRDRFSYEYAVPTLQYTVWQLIRIQHVIDNLMSMWYLRYSMSMATRTYTPRDRFSDEYVGDV